MSGHLSKRRFSHTSRRFRIGYYVIATLQVLSVIFLVTGQTVSLLAYDWTVRQGLQESEAGVGLTMVQVNKATAVTDTILYIPLVITSAVGLWYRRRWSLICTAASAALHSYWSLVTMFQYGFLFCIPDVTYQPDASTVGVDVSFVLYGIAILTFQYVHWDLLLEILD